MGITEKWCQAKVADIVLSVPGYFGDAQRQALLDAAKIANLPVLRIMNEHTATALAYGIYRSNDFDPEKPMTVAFCSVGHSLFSVSIVQFVRGKLTVIAEKCDKVGGRDMDGCLMREFAAQFKKKHGCDPLSNKKAAFKLEDAVTKTKKTLSANSEAPVSVECLMEDEDFSSSVLRTDFETMCAPLMTKVRAVLDGAIATAGIPVEQIDSVEIVGGSSRVPWVKRMCSEAFGGKELSTTMNADESVARGCALQAAILSPLYKVRDFKVEDTTPFGINVRWEGIAGESEAQKEDNGDTQMTNVDDGQRIATVFPAGSLMGTLKLLTFFRKGSFDVKAEYVDEKLLLPLTPKELGVYKIEVPPQTQAKKIKVRAKLSLHGTFVIDGAQMVEDEEYEETVKEKRELPSDPVAESTDPAKETKTDSGNGDAPMPDQGASKDGESKKETATPPKEPEKKYEWVDVVKKRKRTKKTDLNIIPTGVPGLVADALQKRMDEETAMQSEMKDIIETDEKRNDLESYIFSMRDKTAESGDYGMFISSADRTRFLDELKSTGDSVTWRAKEHAIRDEWIGAVTGTIANYRKVAQTPGEKYGHIATEKLQTIIQSCNELEKWLKDNQTKQAGLKSFEKPVLLCAEMEKQNIELARVADEVLKEPKPAPPKEEPTSEKAAASAKDESKQPESADGPQNMDVD